jgi:hypothetical protein
MIEETAGNIKNYVVLINNYYKYFKSLYKSKSLDKALLIESFSIIFFSINFFDLASQFCRN